MRPPDPRNAKGPDACQQPSPIRKSTRGDNIAISPPMARLIALPAAAAVREAASKAGAP
jgi:hypothetical protein